MIEMGGATGRRGMPRRVLIVSPYFPPSTVAGVHRARHLATHLPAAGWEPTVLCVDKAYHTERLDPGLAELLPPGIDIVKVPAFSAAPHAVLRHRRYRHKGLPISIAGVAGG